MSHSKIKVLLRKIESITTTGEALSALEKDLVKRYLRDLYELIDSPVNKAAPEVKTAVTIDPAEKTLPAEPKMSQKSTRPVEKIEAVAEPRQQKGPKIESSVNRNVERNGLKHPSTDAGSEAEPITAPPTPVWKVTRAPETPAKFKPLFDSDSGNDLSDKLSKSPVGNLHKALGINDKMLVISSLFGGDADFYGETIDILNSKYSFEEAKTYLIRYVVDRFEWLDEERVDKARDFIKLVERRYMRV